MLESTWCLEAVFSIPAVSVRCAEMNPRADAPLLQVRHEALAIDSGFGFIHANDEQMPRMTMIPIGKCQWFDTRDVGQFLEITIRNDFSSVDEVIQSLELAYSKRGVHVGKVVLESRRLHFYLW